MFRARCTVHKMVCDLIIDNGSSEDVVSMPLGFRVEKHPNIYKMGWIRKGIEVKVIGVREVPFSVGKFYQDVAWCDVVEIDTCHNLLGRRWEIDIEAIHKGRGQGECLFICLEVQGDNTDTFKGEGGEKRKQPLENQFHLRFLNKYSR